MFKIPKQEYTIEFKDGAVQRVSSGQGIRAVAKDLGLIEHTRRIWVKAPQPGKPNLAGGKEAPPSKWSSRGCGPKTLAMKIENEILDMVTRIARSQHRVAKYQYAVALIAAHNLQETGPCRIAFGTRSLFVAADCA